MTMVLSGEVYYTMLSIVLYEKGSITSFNNMKEGNFIYGINKFLVAAYLDIYRWITVSIFSS